MASDVGQGDSELAVLDVAPADAGTTVELTVTAPDGTTDTVTMVAGDLVEIPDTSPVGYSCRFTADTPVVYDAPGKWILHYEVAGTGEGAEDLEVFVVPSPVAGGPTWLPGRSRVAAYVPRRTLVRSTTALTGSKDSYLYSWDSTTVPTGIEVDRLIADGANIISSRVNPMHASSEATASTLVAYWVAICVERTWPDSDQSLQRANDMERQFNTMLTALVGSNQDLLDEESGQVDGFDIVYSSHSFPVADPRWDCPTSW